MKLDNFIEKSNRIHGTRYDYTISEYTSSRTPTRIICNIHGIFEQTPSNHLSGHGCKTCAIELRTGNLSDFVESAESVHGDRYDYTLVEYSNTKTKISIICPEHGIFNQEPRHHISGVGCPICGGTKSLTTAGFVNRAIHLHESQYDYEKVIYVNAHTKVCIICPHHGEFYQTPNGHLSGKGCIQCQADSFRSSNNEFIAKSTIVHGTRYDYSAVEYFTSKNSVIIGCPKHGEFRQQPDSHIRGSGCPACSGRVSGISQRWLDSLGITNDAEHREVPDLIPGRRYTVDGYDPITNTVYEFHGDYWHGNPKIYAPDDINESTGSTYGQLYIDTLEKQQCFEQAGYQWVEIWEFDWYTEIRNDA